MSKYFIHDTETTGIEGEDRIIETAHLLIENGELVDYREDLCNPGIRIKPEAAMAHAYRNSDIKGKPTFDKTKSCEVIINASEDKDTYYVAHNAPFDLSMLLKEGIAFKQDRVIDTLKIAQHLYEDNEEVKMKKLQYFRFFFEDYFEEKEKDYMVKVGVDHIRPHTALSDILVLWIFLDKIKEDFKLNDEKLVELSQTPVLLKRLNIGKVFPKGTSLEYIVGCDYTNNYGQRKKGYEYLDWFVQEQDAKRSVMDLNLEYSAKYYISHGILNGTVFCTSKFYHYLNFGILFFFNKIEIEDAIRKQGKGSNEEDFIKFYNTLCSQYVEKTSSKIRELEENMEELEEMDNQILQKSIFMLNYFINFRQNVL